MGSVPSSSKRETPFETWQLFFPDEVLADLILKPTNEHRKNREMNWNAEIAEELISHGSAGMISWIDMTLFSKLYIML